MPSSSNLRARMLGALLAAGAAAMWPSGAMAQGNFPDRPIRLIVPQAPGSATDLLARSISAEVEQFLNQKIIVENKPGAAFTIGLDLVAKAAPDGYTLGMGPVGALAISPNMVAKMPYDILRDFQPVAQLTRGHLLLAVSPKSDIRSVQELIARGEEISRQADQRVVGQRFARPCRRRAVQGHDRHRTSCTCRIAAARRR